MKVTSRTLADYLYIITGSLITALAVTVFLNPAQLAPGGVSGIATILFHIFGWDLGTVMLVLNIPIFFIGLRLFGKQYGFRTLLGSMLLSLFTIMWTRVFGEGGVLDYSKEISLLFSGLYGGVLSGIGMGLVMKSGSNTGGTDIIAQIIARYTHLSLGTALFIVDGAVITVSAFSFGLDTALFAIAVAYITTAVINKVVLSMGTSYAKTVFIVSDEYERIGRFITEDMERGATLLDAKGFYSRKSRPMLMTVIPNQQISKLTRAVHQADPLAFMVISETYHVLGEGYTPMEKIAETSDVTQH